MSLLSGKQIYYPLCDAELIRISNKATVTTRVHDILMVEMLKRLAPSLLTFPLADDQWAFWCSESNSYKPSADAEPVSPVSIDRFSRAKVKWRFATGTDLYNVFLEICCSSSTDERLYSLVDRSRLHEVFKNGTLLENRIAKFLWNVAGIAMVLRGIDTELELTQSETVSVRVDRSWHQVHWMISKRVEKKLQILLTNQKASPKTIELIWRKIINPLIYKAMTSYNLNPESLRDHLARYSLITSTEEKNHHVLICADSFMN